MLRLVEYSAPRRDAVIALWNRVFRAMRNHAAFDRATWRARIEDLRIRGEGEALAGSGPLRFDPRHFRIALAGEDAVGIVHGGTWEEDFLARLLPGGKRARVGTLLLIAVDPGHRRRGVGRALIADLISALGRTSGIEAPLRADGRGYNPFYGGFSAPRPPPWGTPQGIALPAGDAAGRAFFRAMGFREEAEALTRVRSLADSPRFAREIPAGLVVEEVADWQPILGTDDGAKFRLANESRTWILREGDHQRAALVAYPLGAGGSRWGIHSFEVETSHRGEGLGRLLLEYAIAAIARRGAAEIEALAIPAEAPEGDGLAERLGFAAADRWVILG